MTQQISERKASQGTKEHLVRYILAISLTLVIVGFAVVYFLT